MILCRPVSRLRITLCGRMLRREQSEDIHLCSWWHYTFTGILASLVRSATNKWISLLAKIFISLDLNTKSFLRCSFKISSTIWAGNTRGTKLVNCEKTWKNVKLSSKKVLATGVRWRIETYKTHFQNINRMHITIIFSFLVHEFFEAILPLFPSKSPPTCSRKLKFAYVVGIPTCRPH